MDMTEFSKPLPPISTRREAHANGKVRFFTGRPCKQGHVTERYVSTGACIGCLGGYFKFRRNPWTDQLAAFVPSKLWGPQSLAPEKLADLDRYMQVAVYHWMRGNGLMTEEIEKAAADQLARM